MAFILWLSVSSKHNCYLRPDQCCIQLQSHIFCIYFFVCTSSWYQSWRIDIFVYTFRNGNKSIWIDKFSTWVTYIYLKWKVIGSRKSKHYGNKCRNIEQMQSFISGICVILIVFASEIIYRFVTVYRIPKSIFWSYTLEK